MRTTILALSLGLAFSAHAVDLPAALQGAQAADPTLASAMANRDASFENIAIARSRLLPQISLQATHQNLQQTTVNTLGTNEFSGTSSNTQLNLRQALFRPRDWAGLSIGKLQAQYGEYKLASAQSDLWSRTVIAWTDVLAAIAMRDAYAQGVASAEAAAQQEQKRFAGGDGTRDQVAEASAQLQLAQAQLKDADLELEGRRRAFKLLTRLDATGFEKYRVPEASRIPVVLASEDDTVQRIVESNPELMAARVNEVISERKLAQARSDHLPTVDLIGSAARAQNDSTNTLGTRYNNHQIGFQLVVPIYSGGGISATQRQFAALYTAATADREALDQRLRSQLTVDWNSLGGLQEKIGSAQELVKSAREQRRGAELGLKAGVKTWADVSAADQLIARRESDRINMVATLVKIQTRILSLMPTGEPAWDRWMRALSAAVQP